MIDRRAAVCLVLVLAACGGSRPAAPRPGVVARAQRVIAIGQNLTGQLQPSDAQLADNFRYQTFEFVARGNESVTIDAMSGDFDPYLMVRDAANNTLATDDDTGEGRNARLAFTFPGPGTYRIMVGTYNQGRGGAYSLSVR